MEVHPRPTGRDGEGLAEDATVDLDGVGAVAALVEVAVVAGVPDEPVIARLAIDLVGAVAAGEGVVAVAAVEEVDAALAQQGVVVRLAEELVGAVAAAERVVAGLAGELVIPPSRR